jgi:hypothetical protein
MTEPHRAELVDLQAAFLVLCGVDDLALRQQLVYAFLLRPVSQEKLRTACAVLLRRTRVPRDLQEDLRQEAMLLLSERLSERRFTYRDRGSDAFGGWLWMQWLASCHTAWQKIRPLWFRRIETRQVNECDRLLSRRQSSDPGQRLGDLLGAAPTARTRRILEDWLAGYTIRESAFRQSFSKTEVGRLRRAIVEHFRREASRDDE